MKLAITLRSSDFCVVLKMFYLVMLCCNDCSIVNISSPYICGFTVSLP